MAKMKKIISLSLALAMTATSFAGLVAGATGTVITVDGKSIAVADTNNTASLDVTLETTATDITVNGVKGGTTDVVVVDGKLKVHPLAKTGAYTISGKGATKNLVLNVVSTKELNKATKELYDAQTADNAVNYGARAFQTLQQSLAKQVLIHVNYIQLDSHNLLASDIAVAPYDATQAKVNALEGALKNYKTVFTGGVAQTEINNLNKKVAEVNALHKNRLAYTDSAWTDYKTKVAALVKGAGNAILSGTAKDLKVLPLVSSSDYKYLTGIDAATVNAMTTELNKMIVEVKKHTTSELSALDTMILTVNSVKKSDYTVSDFSGFAAKVTEAIGKSVVLKEGTSPALVVFDTDAVAKNDATIQDVKDATAALKLAMDVLTINTEASDADLTALDTAIEKVNAEVSKKNAYDLLTFSTFESSVGAAVDGVIIDNKITDTTLIERKVKASDKQLAVTVKGVTDALNKALEELPKSQKDLQTVVETINSRVQSNYTADSWVDFNKALADALNYSSATITGVFPNISIKTDLSSPLADTTNARTQLIAAAATLVSKDYDNGFDLNKLIITSTQLSVNYGLDNTKKFTDKSVGDALEALKKLNDYAGILDANTVKLGGAFTSKSGDYFKHLTQAEINAFVDASVATISTFVAKDSSIKTTVEKVNVALSDKTTYTDESKLTFVEFLKTAAKNNSVFAINEDATTVTLKDLKNVAPSTINAANDTLETALKKLVNKDSNWVKLANGTYNFIKADGKMAKSEWVLNKNSWYYFDENGVMQTGWEKVNGTWYYLEPSWGGMVTGWKLINGKYYYMDKSGAMQTGWEYVDNKWYFMNSAGDMKANTWYKEGSTWYYLNQWGDASAGKWQWINGKCYYFYTNAKMAVNTSIDGYKLDASGAWVK